MLRVITDPLNQAKIVNAISSPGMAKKYVAGLVAINGTTRMLAAEMDKKEKPSARHYAAAIAGLQEGFALTAHFLLTPLFALGGLYAGKHLLAKKAFKNAAKNMQLSPEQLEFMGKYANKAKKSAFNLFEPVKKVLGLDKITEGLEEIHRYNGLVLNKVRTGLDEGKQIIVSTGGNTYRAIKQTAEKGKDNVLSALEGDNNALVDFVGDAKKLQEDGKALIVTPLKQIGDKTTHNNVLGSEKLGEAIGMATALTIVSPMFSIRLVPVLLKKLGLDKKDGKNNPFKEVKPKFAMATKLKEQGFDI